MSLRTIASAFVLLLASCTSGSDPDGAYECDVEGVTRAAIADALGPQGETVDPARTTLDGGLASVGRDWRVVPGVTPLVVVDPNPLVEEPLAHHIVVIDGDEVLRSTGCGGGDLSTSAEWTGPQAAPRCDVDFLEDFGYFEEDGGLYVWWMIGYPHRGGEIEVIRSGEVVQSERVAARTTIDTPVGRRIDIFSDDDDYATSGDWTDSEVPTGEPVNYSVRFVTNLDETKTTSCNTIEIDNELPQWSCTFDTSLGIRDEFGDVAFADPGFGINVFVRSTFDDDLVPFDMATLERQANLEMIVSRRDPAGLRPPGVATCDTSKLETPGLDGIAAEGPWAGSSLIIDYIQRKTDCPSCEPSMISIEWQVASDSPRTYTVTAVQVDGQAADPSEWSDFALPWDVPNLLLDADGRGAEVDYAAVNQRFDGRPGIIFVSSWSVDDSSTRITCISLAPNPETDSCDGSVYRRVPIVSSED